jgi:multidrug resistance efflux pump
MRWLRKTRLAFFIVGLALCIGTLVGARTLTGGSADKSKGDNAPRSTSSGPVVMGTVDTDPPKIEYGLPPVLQSGTVSRVFVKDGDEITAEMIRANKHALYAFDDTIPKANLATAKTAVTFANTKVKAALEGVKQHDENINTAKSMVENAERKCKLEQQRYNITEDRVEEGLKAQGRPKEKWAELKETNPDLFKARIDYDAALREKKLAEQQLRKLTIADPQVMVKEAEAAVDQAKAEQAKAQDVVDLCVVKAQMPGTIEQVTIGPGATLGISTRTPALWLIPAGPRVVRAEVEADFAHRVGPDRIGRQVTIYDHTDTKLTYKGTVRRISNTFLLKRANAENFLNGDTRVIEVVVEVADPAPADKPPLRVGQRVRVNLGQ